MGPAKRQKAEKLGIKILNEQEFMALISNVENTATDATSEPAAEAEERVVVDTKPIQGTLF
jgi:BRCT domain type II-containing protein